MTEKTKVQFIVEELNIIDDTLFQKMAESIGFCEEMISTILEKKVTVKSVTPQNSVKNLQGRSVILDALCVFEDGTECNVEVQKANDDNHIRRVRYNTSCLTANITDPGVKFENVPDVIGILISKFDIFKAGKTIYHIDRMVRETGEAQDNGLKEIYVNTKIDDGSDIAELMHIFSEKNAYNFEKFPNVSNRKAQFKKSEGGKEEMCEAVENYVKEVAETAVEKYAKEVAAVALQEAKAASEKEVQELKAASEKEVQELKAASEKEVQELKAASEKEIYEAKAAAKDNLRKNAYNLLKNGVPYEIVKRSIVGLADEEVHRIYKQVMEESYKM